MAENLLSSGSLGPIRGFQWAPGYPYFLAGAAQLGDQAITAKALQVGLSILTLFVLFSWVRDTFDERIALGSAWLFALYPTLIAFTHYLWSETLYIFLLVSAVALMFRALRELSRWRTPLLVSSGVLFGGAALVRPVALYFSLFWLLWLVVRGEDKRRGLRTAVTLGLGCLLTVAPWAARNAFTLDAFVPIDTTLGVNLWRGNANPAVANWDYGFDRRPRSRGVMPGFPECQPLDLVARDCCNTKRSLQTIAASPASFLRRIPTKILDLINPTSFLIRHARWGLYGPLSRGTITVLTLLILVSYMGVALSAAAGLIAFPATHRSPRAALARQFLVALIVYTLALHAITFGMSRFRLPVLPFLFPFAVLAWYRWKECLSLPPRRSLAIVLVWMLLMASWARRLPILLDLSRPITAPPRLRPMDPDRSTPTATETLPPSPRKGEA